MLTLPKLHRKAEIYTTDLMYVPWGNSLFKGCEDLDSRKVFILC